MRVRSNSSDSIPDCFHGIPFLPDARVERIVRERLEKYARVVERPARFPIDIETMVELVEKIPVEYFDETKFDEEVLGAYDFTAKKMLLLASQATTRRGRFTQAHEYGHFVLHAPHFLQQTFQFDDEVRPGAVQLLRATMDRGNTLEAQANLFAGHFLMPTNLVEVLIGPHLGTASDDDLVSVLSEAADVNRQPARIRLEKMGKIQRSE